ncbi:MAG: glycosyltransferase family 4 protein [Candidatus Bathyarchaeia archaeon]
MVWEEYEIALKVSSVLMLTSSYPISNSNLGTFIRNIASCLVRKGLRVGCLVFSASGKFSRYIDQEGVEVIEYPYSWFLPPSLHKGRGLIPSLKVSLIAKLEIPLYLLATFLYLRKFGKDFEIIHSQWFIPSGYIACACKKSIARPVITTAWGAEFHLPNLAIVRFILNTVLRKSDRTTTVSGYMKERAAQYLKDTDIIEIIPNAIDYKRFQVTRRKKEKMIIAAVRRLVPEKKIDDLIKAFANVPENLKEKCELWIVGDGPEKENLKKLIRTLKISNFTRFLGMVSYDRIPELLSQVDICVNPSMQEGMATINLESMASGCCTIATKGYGNDEVLLDGETGLLYEPGNIDSLSSLLEMCIENFPSNMGENAKREIENKYSIEKITEKYIAIYDSLKLD